MWFRLLHSDQVKAGQEKGGENECLKSLHTSVTSGGKRQNSSKC